MPDAGLDPEPLPDQVRVGRRVTDPDLSGIARALEALPPWPVLRRWIVAGFTGGFAVFGAVQVGLQWLGWKSVAPAAQFEDIRRAQARSDSIGAVERQAMAAQFATQMQAVTSRMDRSDGRMERMERLMTQYTLGQCIQQKRANPDAWAICNRDLKDLLSQ